MYKDVSVRVVIEPDKTCDLIAPEMTAEFNQLQFVFSASVSNHLYRITPVSWRYKLDNGSWQEINSDAEYKSPVLSMGEHVVEMDVSGYAGPVSKTFRNTGGGVSLAIEIELNPLPSSLYLSANTPFAVISRENGEAVGPQGLLVAPFMDYIFKVEAAGFEPQLWHTNNLLPGTKTKHAISLVPANYWQVRRGQASNGGDSFEVYEVALNPQTAPAPMPVDIMILLDASHRVSKEQRLAIYNTALKVTRTLKPTDRLQVYSAAGRISSAFGSLAECSAANLELARLFFDRYLENKSSVLRMIGLGGTVGPGYFERCIELACQEVPATNHAALIASFLVDHDNSLAKNSTVSLSVNKVLQTNKGKFLFYSFLLDDAGGTTNKLKEWSQLIAADENGGGETVCCTADSLLSKISTHLDMWQSISGYGVRCRPLKDEADDKLAARVYPRGRALLSRVRPLQYIFRTDPDRKVQGVLLEARCLGTNGASSVPFDKSVLPEIGQVLSGAEIQKLYDLLLMLELKTRDRYML